MVQGTTFEMMVIVIISKKQKSLGPKKRVAF